MNWEARAMSEIAAVVTIPALTSTSDLIIRARSYNACGDSIEWLETLPGDQPAQATWEQCPRGDWLLWFAAKAGVERKTVVLAACAAARLALPFVEHSDDRPRVAIETAERWARGEATIEDVHAARAAAAAAEDAAAARAAAAAAEDAAAAYAAAYAAASAAYAAAYAAASAAYAAASAAAYAAARAAAYAALTKMRLETAAAVRKVIPICP